MQNKIPSSPNWCKIVLQKLRLNSSAPIMPNLMLAVGAFCRKIKKRTFIQVLLLSASVICFCKSYHLCQLDSYLYEKKTYKCFVKQKYTEQYNANGSNSRTIDLRTKYIFICQNENDIFEVNVNSILYHTTIIESIVYFKLSLRDIHKDLENVFVIISFLVGCCFIVAWFLYKVCH